MNQPANRIKLEAYLRGRPAISTQMLDMNRAKLMKDDILEAEQAAGHTPHHPNQFNQRLSTLFREPLLLKNIDHATDSSSGERCSSSDSTGFSAE
jgi:hypothetical protein